MEIKQVYSVNGKEFATKAEAQDYLRRPKIEAALKNITGDNPDLVTWLLDNQETVEMAFESGTIRRVTKSEHAKLAKALEAVAEANNPKFAFLVENAAAVRESFRHPTVKRMTDEEKVVLAKNTIVAASNNAELADWIISNKTAILEAYQAGVEKRAVNEKAQAALKAYREQKAAEKAAASQ